MKLLKRCMVVALMLFISNQVTAQTVLQRTSYIGTAENPTMDGGIINAADGLPVHHDVSLSSVSSDKAINQPSKIVVTASAQKPFQDDWATSAKVKQVLTQAAQQGKLAYVLKKSDEMHLPASVALVPLIESGYQNVTSPKGAAGVWQLMPSVAKDYGITSEERFQFEPATDTALKLLRQLHQKFGSWELAFAAYNAGATRVETALRQKPKATSVQALNLPVETRQYVKKIKAANDALINIKHVYPDDV